MTRFYLKFSQVKKAYDELTARNGGATEGYMFNVEPFDPPAPDENFVRCRQEVSDLKSVVRVPEEQPDYYIRRTRSLEILSTRLGLELDAAKKERDSLKELLSAARAERDELRAENERLKAQLTEAENEMGGLDD